MKFELADQITFRLAVSTDGNGLLYCGVIRDVECDDDRFVEAYYLSRSDDIVQRFIEKSDIIYNITDDIRKLSIL